MDINKTWLEELLAKYDRDNSTVGIQSMVTESAVSAGDNYTSVIIRAALEVVLGSGSVTNKKVIIKKRLLDLPPNILADIKSIFHQEGIVFNNILAVFERCFKEYKVPYDKFWADCYAANHEAIVFEDLKESGYILSSRQKGLDIEHATIVFTALARFHSTSIVTSAKGLICPKLLPSYLLFHLSVCRTLIPNGMSAVAEAIDKHWGPEWSDLVMNIRKMSKDANNILRNLLIQEHKLSVVNHGDCWTSNMMFKYDKDGSPTNIKLMDFQITHYNSYAWDMTHFLYSSVNVNYLKGDFDSFIQSYHKEFKENLLRLGSDPSQTPTIEEIKSELERLKPYGLAVTCAMRPIASNSTDVELSLEDLLNQEKFDLLFQNDKVRETMKVMLSGFKNFRI